MLTLLFLGKRSRVRANEGHDQSRTSCPRCHINNATNYKYCINCGNELRRPSQQLPPVHHEEALTAHVDENAKPKSSARAIQNADDEPWRPVSSLDSDPLVEAERDTSPQDLEHKVPSPTKILVFKVMPTGPSLTDRGIALFNQGRYLEAIDQFTKAVAVDPNYKIAWKHRAEAHIKLGKREEAAEDMRRLKAI
jgi:tetratricopeptide (TPR) repeat protein